MPAKVPLFAHKQKLDALYESNSNYITKIRTSFLCCAHECFNRECLVDTPSPKI
jgi:hypothetical protein